MVLRQRRLIRRALVPTLVLSLVAALGACTPEPDDVVGPPAPAAPALVRDLGVHTTTLPASDPAELALTASQLVFTEAPVLVVASLGDDAAAPALTAVATALAAPVLLADGPADRSVRSEAERLGARAAVVVEQDRLPVDGEPASSSATDTAEAAGLQVVHLDPDAAVITDGDGDAVVDPHLLDDLRAELGDALPTAAPDLLTEVLALVDPAPGQEAALATLRAAGAVTREVAGGDPGASAQGVGTLTDAQALTVIGVGPGFDDEATFDWQVAAAERGLLLPHRTQRVQGVVFAATAARVSDEPDRVLAATDDDPPTDPDDPATPVPALVLRASQRLWSAGPDGTFLRAESVEALTPLVEAAHRTGRYVVLEVEGGSVALLDQVRALEPLLAGGGVGVLVHPEQRRSGAGRTQGGAVDVDELQAVVDHLAALVTEHALPQALLAVASLETGVEGVDGLVHRPQVAVADSTVLEGLR
ncbi:hypothetical protein Xcel_2738 [Xylanimonas cellulosilytica DSM 15894]|uniref:Lipoprotein n=1 Tax=Xylanimonas cellulosilytica (strain DSM 15894 / JCM 12276 / CECT 5975 / KCTC 9989 / LMG 20990 / NBRC 107835 / XIL07) TaxID=446471 RepID=D1BXW1_XYLCX|nr:hypothetical protein [Xylanimonas cellulosilytica]ACZ31752.1 hypothetical protein Xcel_2738 [Xylanimonas cellulosilytica DSM 15894]